MKRFAFGLQTVLEWRDRLEERERGVLEGLHADRRRLEGEGEHILRQIADSYTACAVQCPTLSHDLHQLAGYLAALRTRADQVRSEVADCSRSIEEQTDRVRAAKRDHELLLKLRDRRMADWRYELSRETDAGAEESWIAGFVRESARSTPDEDI